MISSVAVAFGVLALGWLCRARGLIGPEADRPFNDYLYYVAMPALILERLASCGLSGVDARLLAANALPGLLLLSGLLLARRVGLLRAGAGELLLCSALGNTVYLGFPLTSMRFGEDAVSLASVVASMQNLVVFTAGFAALAFAAGAGPGRSGEGSRRVLSRNMLLWSSLLGGALALAGLRLPGLLARALALIGQSTAPLALFALGMFLYGKPLGRRPGAVLRLCALKLAVFPLLFVLCARALGLRGLGADVSLLESLMPLAVTNFVLAGKLGLDEELVAEAILASTLLCAPLLLAFEALRGFLP